MARAMKYYGLEEKKAKEAIEKTDKKRAAYYNYYTTQRWGEFENYHMAIHTDSVGIDGCVDILERFVIDFENKLNS
jgi:cytidylate kinase